MMFMGKTTDDLRLIGFEPVVGTEPRVLILGSMPSEASLAAGCYYAHPRNRFWRVVGECFGFDPTLPYKERLDALEASGAALWDTIESCERTGSLDSAILRPQVNDFPAFFAAHPTIERVCLNGGKAVQMWRRHAVPVLTAHADMLKDLDVRVLPSTSPANARMGLEDLLALWRPALYVQSNVGKTVNKIVA
jgi:hypothetical protein